MGLGRDCKLRFSVGVGRQSMIENLTIGLADPLEYSLWLSNLISKYIISTVVNFPPWTVVVREGQAPRS